MNNFAATLVLLNEINTRRWFIFFWLSCFRIGWNHHARRKGDPVERQCAKFSRLHNERETGKAASALVWSFRHNPAQGAWNGIRTQTERCASKNRCTVTQFECVYGVMLWNSTCLRDFCHLLLRRLFMPDRCYHAKTVLPSKLHIRQRWAEVLWCMELRSDWHDFCPFSVFPGDCGWTTGGAHECFVNFKRSIQPEWKQVYYVFIWAKGWWLWCVARIFLLLLKNMTKKNV